MKGWTWFLFLSLEKKEKTPAQISCVCLYVFTHNQNKLKKKKKVILKESFCVRGQVLVCSLNPSSVFARSREKFLKCSSVTHWTKQLEFACVFFCVTFRQVIPLWWSIKQTGARQWYLLRCTVRMYSGIRRVGYEAFLWEQLKVSWRCLKCDFQVKGQKKMKSTLWNFEKPQNLSCVSCLLALICFRWSSSHLLSLC